MSNVTGDGNQVLDLLGQPVLVVRDRGSRQTLMPAPRPPDGSLRSSARHVQVQAAGGLIERQTRWTASYGSYGTPSISMMPRPQPQIPSPPGSVFINSTRTRPEGQPRVLMVETQVADSGYYVPPSPQRSLPLATVLSNSPVARVQATGGDFVFWGSVAVMLATAAVVASKFYWSTSSPGSAAEYKKEAALDRLHQTFERVKRRGE